VVSPRSRKPVSQPLRPPAEYGGYLSLEALVAEREATLGG
jgi:hypothetical protein